MSGNPKDSSFSRCEYINGESFAPVARRIHKKMGMEKLKDYLVRFIGWTTNQRPYTYPLVSSGLVSPV